MGFEVNTVVIMKNAVSPDVTPCSPVLTCISEEHIASIFRIKKFLNLKICGTCRYICALMGQIINGKFSLRAIFWRAT